MLSRSALRALRKPPRAASQLLRRRSTMGDVSAGFSSLAPRTIAAIGLTAVAGGASLYYISKADRANVRQYAHRSDSPRALSSQQRTSQKSEPDSQTEDDSSEAEAESDSQGYFPRWSSVGDKVAESVGPKWAKSLPGLINKLQNELTDAPGTLADEMWQEANDPEVHPEIMREATVRISADLCDEEREFLEKRKRHTKKALARYLEVPEKDIHPEDVPVIAMCGSGGGLRAMVAGTSSYLSAQRAGLFDCITYTAGVSGSCWLQALFYSSITGQRHDRLIDHLKQRLGVHIAYPPALLELLTKEPTNKFLLAGGFEKWKGYKEADFGLVDVYGVMLGARLLVPQGEINVDLDNNKLSHQQRFLSDGENPLPIYTAVRHEIPSEETMKGFSEEDKETAKKEAWFQWFESTPYEFWCEELEAGIPTWSVGRHFKEGKTAVQYNGLSLPELRVPLLMGIWGSAFCATLSHYYHEIRPLLKSFSGFGGLDDLIEQRNKDLIKVHPVEPAQIPNFVLGLREQLPDSCPASLESAESLQLMDAGMSNNLPIYPLLRPGRDVDMIIAFDASADIKSENWLRVADGYARQRGIRAWPRGTGFPQSDNDSDGATGEELDRADEATSAEAESKMATAEQDQKDASNGPDREGEEQNPQAMGESQSSKPAEGLDFCNIWVGTTEERSYGDEPPPSKQVSEDWQLMHPNAGIAVVYFPFLANPKVEGVDPQTSEFMSTWNFTYRPEDVDKVVSLAQANFDAGKDKVKRAVRAIYERKKKMRLEREASDK